MNSPAVQQYRRENVMQTGSLFMKYSDAFCTTLFVKDRVTGHNPLAALSLYKSYYRRLTHEEFLKGGSVKVIVEKN